MTIHAIEHARAKRERSDRLSPLLRSRPRPSCYPHAFALNEQDRTVVCSKCKSRFEAFDAMMYLVRNWTTYEANRTSLRHEAEKLKGEVEKLRVQRSTAKQAIKREA